MKQVIVFINPRDYYLDVIQYAKNLYPVVCCHLMHNEFLPKHEELSYHYLNDLTQHEDLFHAVIEEDNITKTIAKFQQYNFEIKAVIPGSETGINTADTLADILQLPGNDPKTILARRNKYYMKQAARQAGLRCPDFKKCYDTEDINQFIKNHPFPIVIKSPSLHSSLNVYICDCVESLFYAFDAIIKTDTYAIIEEYIHGTEYVVNLFAHSNRFVVTDIWQHNKTTTQHTKNLHHKATKLFICIRELSNFDPILSTINCFLGEPLSFVEKIQYEKYAEIAYCGSHHGGTVSKIIGLEEIQNLSSYHHHNLYVNIGDRIEPSRNLEDIRLMVYFMNTDKEQLIKDSEATHRLFDLAISKENKNEIPYVE